MSRYTGPRVKILRRFGQQLPGLTRKGPERRPYPPGQHGQRRRRRTSDYRVRLEEKQKLRYNYGVGERQFRRYIKKATREKGDTGINLLKLLESRLDNVVYRAAYGCSIPACRQLVNHGHIRVNGQKVDIPSYHVEPGDVITLRERSKSIQVIKDSVEAPVLIRPAYLEWDPNALKATMKQEPTREDIPVEIQENLIVEFYSQKV